MARSIRAAGGRTGMIIHNAYGYGLFTGGLGVHYGAEQLGCTVVPISGGMTERQVQLINDFRPDIITVTPSYMLAILDEFKRRGLDPRKSSLKFGIFGAEPWTNAMRAEIEDAFDMDATDIYGLSEVIGPGVAQECVETKDGLHIWEDHFYPEVIDPETGEVLPDGEKGELVFTSLTKEGFPVIRYRTRDLTRLLPGTARPGMRRMEKVTGRSDDMIILRGVNVFPTQIEEVLLATDWCGGHFIIELTREGRMDEMADPRRSAPRALGRQRARRNMPRRSSDLHQEHHRHHRRRSGSSRRTRWNARSARPSVFTTSGRKGNSCPREPGKPGDPDMTAPPKPVAVEARCVRLNAKAENAAALAPAVERHTLSRAANEVLIEVKAAAVNPSDVKAATGLMPYAVFPRTSGRDYAGVVIDGPSGTIGREVFGSSGDLGIRRDGTHATHLAVEAEATVEKPKGMSWEEAAGIGVPFVTAMEGFRRAGIPKPGETVLVMGVTGKVGQAAVQIATWHGARAIGVTRKAEAYEGHANSPVEVIDASATDVAARARELTGGKGVDIVFNTVGDPYFQAAHKSLALARPPDPDRRDRPHRAVQHPGILSRPAHLCRHRYARVCRRSRPAMSCASSHPALPAGS